jgi:hypothetical protein
MNMPRREIVKRIILCLLAGFVLGAVITEVSYFLLKTPQDRGPQQIELVIPAGTAEHVAHGEPGPSIPADLTFVVGDTLVVRNEDAVSHQLGPLFIPSGTSASLHLDTVASYAYTCSFRPGQYIGLDVREPVTWSTRLTGVLFTGLPMGLLFALYAIFGAPYKKATI